MVTWSTGALAFFDQEQNDYYDHDGMLWMRTRQPDASLMSSGQVYVCVDPVFHQKQAIPLFALNVLDVALPTVTQKPTELVGSQDMCVFRIMFANNVNIVSEFITFVTWFTIELWVPCKWYYLAATGIRGCYPVFSNLQKLQGHCFHIQTQQATDDESQPPQDRNYFCESLIVPSGGASGIFCNAFSVEIPMDIQNRLLAVALTETAGSFNNSLNPVRIDAGDYKDLDLLNWAAQTWNSFSNEYYPDVQPQRYPWFGRFYYPMHYDGGFRIYDRIVGKGMYQMCETLKLYDKYGEAMVPIQAASHTFMEYQHDFPDSLPSEG